MSPDKEKQLFGMYPILFNGREIKSFGIECDDGWFDLIVNLCESLYSTRPIPYVFQIKEKFGELRFYVFGSSSEADRLIEETEKLSTTVCETCGADGAKTVGKSWFKTLCPDHAKDYKG